MNKNLAGRLFAGLFTLFFGLNACLNNKTDKQPDIFLDYQINAREGDDKLSILLQFRDAATGDAFELKPPSEVRLDQETLRPDSTLKKNCFYELYKPIDSFTGKHAIIYTDLNHKIFRQQFEFRPFSLSVPIPDTIGRDSLMLDFSGLSADDRISFILTDTAFSNDDINRTVPPGVRKITLTSGDLGNLSAGPLQIEFIRETRIPFIKPGLQGGLQVNYSLKREVYLK